MAESMQTSIENEEINYGIVFNILIYGFIPLYAILLLVLDNYVGTSITDTTEGFPIDIIAGALVVVSLIDIFVAQKVLIPKAERLNDPAEVFPMFLIAIVLLDSIAIYGLLLGLLNLFVIGENVNWAISGGFIAVSGIYSLLMLNTVITPKMESLR